MKKQLLLLALIANQSAFLQTPKLYLNIVSHNEPKDSLHKVDEFNYQAYWVEEFANMIQSKGAKYNLQTCDGFIDGAIDFQNATTVSTDILETLDDMPNVEIDPRYKSYLTGFNSRNYADNAYLLTSIGVNPTHVLGGFLYSSSVGSPDWFAYQNSSTGHAYPTANWQADLLYGPGSFPPHTNDYNDFGVWKPDNINTFSTHNPSRHLWLIGNGCAPLLDSTTAIQPIIDSIQTVVSRLETNQWPNDRFYSATIMINQSNFGPMLYNKLAQVLDSINLTVGTSIEWSLLTEKFSAFQNWQSSSGNEYSQWHCGQMSVGIQEFENTNSNYTIFPNPSSSKISVNFNDLGIHTINLYDYAGKHIQNIETKEHCELDLSNFSNGIYFIKIDNTLCNKIIKE